MILHALANYYQRLADSDDSDLAPFGFSRQQIAFEVVVEVDGTLHDIQPPSTSSENPQAKVSLIVLGGSKPSGSGINPCFLWDNTAYLLGFKVDDPKPARTADSFAAFLQKHLEAEPQIEDPDYSAVCRFLEQWNPEKSADFPILAETTGFGVFRVRGKKHYVHQIDAVKTYWQSLINQSTDAVQGQCLVSGEIAALARLHEPKIKGVSGAQSAGANLVSFNADAYESYQKSQSYNAPVSEETAFQYATALNRLLGKGSSQRIQIGDATSVFWTEGSSRAEAVFGQLLDFSEPEDEAAKVELHSILNKVSQGQYPGELGLPETPFYCLGLSPNAARISVRFWHASTLDDVVQNLHRHFGDLAIAPTHPERDPKYPAVWQLLRETARESKDIPPLLAGGLLRSILEGTPYPDVFYQAVIRRIRADRELRYLRAAILKAYLNRNYHKELPMSLDPARPEASYHLGRLFAALEKSQEDALPGLNATIKDRYFGAASATPSSVFPRLIRLNQHHLSKLDNPGHKIAHEKRIQEIVSRLEDFPSHLPMQDQGLFAIGYYHQRQAFFTKSTKDNSEKE